MVLHRGSRFIPSLPFSFAASLICNVLWEVRVGTRGVSREMFDVVLRSSSADVRIGVKVLGG